MTIDFGIVQSPALYVTPILYGVLLLTPLRKFLFGWLSLGFILIGSSINIFLSTPASGLVSLGVGLIVILLFGILNLTGRATTFLVGVSLVSLPPGAWIFPAAGLLLAGLVSAIVVWRARGSDYMRMVTGETFAAVGLVGGALQKPDLERMPVENGVSTTRETSPDSGSQEAAPYSTPRISMPAFMLASLGVGAVLGLIGAVI